jgi:hypothetical protein
MTSSIRNGSASSAVARKAKPLRRTKMAMLANATRLLPSTKARLLARLWSSAALGPLLSGANRLEADDVLQIHLTSCGAFGPYKVIAADDREYDVVLLDGHTAAVGLFKVIETGDALKDADTPARNRQDRMELPANLAS